MPLNPKKKEIILNSTYATLRNLAFITKPDNCFSMEGLGNGKTTNR
jgi:hypothetical protein